MLLTGLRAQAQLFVGTVPAPKHGEMVPEAALYAFELAHDLLERDHPQMRAALLWFDDEILAKHQVNFVCCMPNGDVRVERFKGRQFTSSDPSSLLGWCVCASAHARARYARLARLAGRVGADGDGAYGCRAGSISHVGLQAFDEGAAEFLW